MKTKILNKFAKIILIFALLAIPSVIKAQSTVMEISWQVYSSTHTGLLVLYPNNEGFLKLCYYDPNVGTAWVEEDAVLTNTFDGYGNCTSFINCFNPRTYPYVQWSADNFVINPDGSMFTMDAAGTWSTLIAARIVPAYEWRSIFNQYNIAM